MPSLPGPPYLLGQDKNMGNQTDQLTSVGSANGLNSPSESMSSKFN